ncbi:virulence factor Mce family protein [Porphyromonas macacae]|uniref:Virulence factor Mce family protein n=1 Tax=Porphyromonas macacae TaxID=28115 RepID=A0A379E696_9PORP|nr:MlaD family protein [Porphyromonas macacae]SUB88176.1 virulence factor Mce family protein [Porphyromonas macacae]
MRNINTLKIGILTLVALGLLFFGIKFLKGINIFSAETPYHTTFSKVNGLTVSTPILIEGYKVGVVRKMDFDFENNKGIRVELSINKRVKLPKDSKVRIKLNPLSGADLIIQLGKSPEFLEPGGELGAINMQTDLMAIAQEKILPMIDSLMPHIDSMVRGVNKQVNNPDIAEAIGYIRNTTKQIEELAKALRVTGERLPPVIANIEQVSDNAIKITNDIQNSDIKVLIKNIEETTNNLRLVTEQLKDSRGTAGKLLSDPGLYDRLNAMVNSADSLLSDIKKNPNRYVHFSVF